MEVMLCPSTVLSSSNAHMRQVNGGDLEESPCEGERPLGLFSRLLEQIVMERYEKAQAASKAEVDSKDVGPLQPDSDETEAEENAVPWCSVMIDPTWLNQSVAAVRSDVQHSDMQGVYRLRFPETDSLIGQVDVQAPIEIALAHEAVANDGTGLEEQMDTEPLPFSEVLQSVSATNVTIAAPDEHKPGALGLTADTFSQALMEEPVSAEEQLSYGLAPTPEAHGSSELDLLQAVERDIVFEEHYRDAFSDLQKVGNSGSHGEQLGEIFSHSSHKGFASFAKSSVESIELELKADKERVPIVPLVGASQVNEQDNMGSANVQGQSGEVQERTIPEQLIESVQYLKYDETKEFDIELTPRELGRVRVSIATDGERLNVHLIAESPSVAEIIKAELPVLRNVLAHQGLMFGQVNVGVGQDGNTNTNLEYRTPTRSAYQVKGLEHTAEDEASHQFSRSDTYGISARLHVDYVA